MYLVVKCSVDFIVSVQSSFSYRRTTYIPWSQFLLSIIIRMYVTNGYHYYCYCYHHYLILYVTVVMKNV
jgi:hypothetical protein